jgi:D-glycero-D-manno-heptose 1,7-bisphosphate phosphatase
MKPLILLDRDGVLNAMIEDPEHGIVDSPLHPRQVAIPSDVPTALKRLNDRGFGLVIVSNQPAAAKGKTTRANLEAVHNEVLKQVQSAGAKILSSHICYHRAEDHCQCRKPKTGLLEAAFRQNRDFTRDGSWIVGDGITDIEAGQTFEILTAFIGPRKSDQFTALLNRELHPNLWCESLADFVKQLATAQSPQGPVK